MPPQDPTPQAASNPARATPAPAEHVLASRLLGTLTLDMGRAFDLGVTPGGWRRMRELPTGTLVGPRINAVVVLGMDAFLRKADNSMHSDARLTLQTDDGALIYLAYRGVRYASAEVMQRIEANQPVGDDEYYLRSIPTFETASPAYDWLNRVIAVGVGRRMPHAAAYTFHEIL